MKEGALIQFAREEDVQSPPAKSMNTRLVAAAIASGIRPFSEGFYSDTVEEVDGRTKRDVTWSMDGGSEAHFVPDFPEEKIDFNEFRRRFLSIDWCEQNPNHPIAYMRGFVEQHTALVDKIKQLRPMILIRKGSRFAIVPSGDDEKSTKEREEILARF